MDMSVEQEVKRVERLHRLADDLMDKLDQAIKELNEMCSVEHQDGEYKVVRVPGVAVDRAGAKQISSSLKDVKDLLTVMDEALSEEGKADGAASMTQEYKDAQAEWLRICQGWKHDYPVVLPKHMNGGTETEANVYAFAYEMCRRLNENQIVVVGNGSANVVCGHANIVKKGQRFIASMGYGLPASIGACVADHSQDIILITGDGSIQMNLQELETVVSHRMPIKIFIINNGGYHSIRQTQKNFFGERGQRRSWIPEHGKAGVGVWIPICIDSWKQGAGREGRRNAGDGRPGDLRGICNAGSEL